jgi:hypothetical protein
LDTPVAGYLLSSDSRKHFLLEESHVNVCVLGFSPTVPDSSNHEIIQLLFGDDEPKVELICRRNRGAVSLSGAANS